MSEKNSVKGYLFAFSGYFIWGILPIYWHELNGISSIEILMSRIIFSAITLIIYICVAKNVRFIEYFRDRKTRNSLMLSALLLGTNWGFFVYAVNSSYVLQASLGYYICPLFNVLLGVLFLKEKLDKYKTLAIILAVIGVLYMTLSLGVFPYISLAIALSFSLYGFIKKKLQLDSYNSLFLESGMLAVIAVTYSTYLFISGSTSLLNINHLQMVLIVLSGVATCLPLILFNKGAKRIPLSALGILQYIAPTLMFLIGVFLYDEVFTSVHTISFAFIWAGCFVYILSVIFPNKNLFKFKNKADTKLHQP